MDSWNTKNSAGAFASALKLSLAGLRNGVSSNLQKADSIGYYWSSTLEAISGQSNALTLKNDNAIFYGQNRAFGIAVRCIKN